MIMKVVKKHRGQALLSIRHQLSCVLRITSSLENLVALVQGLVHVIGTVEQSIPLHSAVQAVGISANIGALFMIQ